MAFLRYTTSGKGTVWMPLDKDVIALGRSKECELPIDDTMASRRHCEIRKLANGFSLVDLKSKNGTFVNGLPVNAWNLTDGDIIAIGNHTMIYKLHK